MSRPLSLAAVLVAVLTVVAVAGCGGAAGTGAGGATSTAGVVSASGQSLARLDPSRLPDTSAAVAALLARMPATVAGHARTNSTTREVRYADGSAFTVALLSEVAPGRSMPTFFTAFAGSGQFTVTGKNVDGAPVLWFVGTSKAPDNHDVAAAASSSGNWLFGVDAVSPAAADEIVAGFTVALG